MDKKGHNNHNWKKSLSQFFARPHGPESQGLFSWEITIEAGPRHSLEMRTSEATSPSSQGSHRESDTALRVSGGTRPGTYSSGLYVSALPWNKPAWERADFAPGAAMWILGTSDKQTPFCPGAVVGLKEEQ